VAAPPWAACAPRCSLRGGYAALLAALLGSTASGGALEAPPTPPSTPGAAAAAQVLARGARTHQGKYA
jgi:hypothetical protein